MTTYNLDAHTNLGGQFPQKPEPEQAPAPPQAQTHGQLAFPIPDVDARSPWAAGVKSPRTGGVDAQVQYLGDRNRARAHLLGPERHDNWVNSPNNASPERKFFQHVPGQTVMDTPGNEGSPRSLELDAHGNAYDPHVNPKVYRTFSPQMSERHAKQFNQHAVPMRLSTSTVLHTLQDENETRTYGDGAGGHKQIQGPIRDVAGQPSNAAGGPIPIVIHEGRPILADGHHRLAEMRARGMTHFDANVFNADQFLANLPKVNRPAPHELVSHLLDHHDVNYNQLFTRGGSERSPSHLERDHAWEHADEPVTHQHPGKTYNLDE